MRRHLLLFIILLTSFGAVRAKDDVRQRLALLLEKAESCYLIDDYQQLHVCIQEYYDLYSQNTNLLSDSLDVYEAYFFKMCGSYYYGWAEDPAYAAMAEDYYRKSLELFRGRVATNNIWGMHKNELTLHKELAQLYYKTKDYIKAHAQLDTIFIYYDDKSDIPSYDADRYQVVSQLAICKARLGLFSEALSLIDEALLYYKRHPQEGYHEAVRKKGKILMLQAEHEGDGDYAKAAKCYEQYVKEQYTSIGRQLASMDASQRAQYWLANHQFLYDCVRLGNHSPEMLYDLALFSKGYLVAYERNQDIAQKNWQQVRRELGEKDCAIEFLQYFGPGEEVRMGCLVLRQGSARPRFIDLFSTDSLLSLPLTSSYTVGEALTATLPAVKDTLYNDRRLPHLIWSPALMAAIGDARKVYFSADGLLHQWAVEYLMPDTQKMCYRLTSTRLIQKKRKPVQLNKALICGGITYGDNIKPTERGNDVTAYRYLANVTSHISELPDAKKEVDSIFIVRANPQDTLLTGTAATDENFIRLLNKGYDVVHLSTHGFYNGNIGIYSDIKPLSNDESMSKSGLLFAGASTTLSAKTFDEDLYDGILSAVELSRQDFSHTKLIVLSACETGLGHLTDDGIYGIQRALKQAGAQAVIVSLWRVNDISCSLLMRYFYEALQQDATADIHDAFLQARQRLMHEQRPYFRFDAATLSIQDDVIKYNTPRHTNPFILIDAF